jgi:hypothetical protein
MPEPNSILAGLDAVKTGFAIAKSVRELVKQPQLDANEVSSQLLLLQQVMLDTQAALNNAANEYQELKSQLDRRGELSADKQWEPDGKFYRRKSDMQAGLNIAYCPICWETNDRAVPLALYNQPGLYKCGLHDPQYPTKEYWEHIRQRDERLMQANRRRLNGI